MTSFGLLVTVTTAWLILGPLTAVLTGRTIRSRDAQRPQARHSR